jgi:hypothetical protein
MTHRILIVLSMVATLPLGGVASAQTATSTSGPKVVHLDRSGRPIATPSAATSTMTRASSLVGRPLVDTTGLSLGRISDLVITPDGQVTTLVELPGGGFTGVPLSSVSTQLDAPGAGAGIPGASGAMGLGGASPQSTAIDRFVFTGDVDQFRSAPVLQDLSTLDEQFPRSIGQHFAVPAGEMRFPEQPTTPAARNTRADSPSMGSAQTARRMMTTPRSMQQRRTPLLRTTPRAQRRVAHVGHDGRRLLDTALAAAAGRRSGPVSRPST